MKPARFDRLTAERQELRETDTEGDHVKALYTCRDVSWKVTSNDMSG